MPKDKVIVYMGLGKWGSMKQRPQHIAERLAENNLVLYVNPARGIRGYLFDTRIKDGLIKISDNLLIIEPIFSLPFSYNYLPIMTTISTYINSKIISFEIRKSLKKLKKNPSILWLSFPNQIFLLDMLAAEITCYDCMDDYANMEKSYQDYFDKLERKLLKKVNLIFASSFKLANKCHKINKHAYLVNNGVDTKHFKIEKSALIGIPEILSQIPKPRIGFYGSIGNWIDIDLLEYLGASKPEWSFIIIGPIHANVEKIKKLKNIYLLGEIHYERLPLYLNKFDICIIPFKLNRLVESVNPVKFYEYLSAGKPIVSTDLKEIKKFGDLCKIAKSKKDFLLKIEESLKENDEDLIRRRLETARDNNWDKRIEIINESIDRFVRS